MGKNSILTENSIGSMFTSWILNDKIVYNFIEQNLISTDFQIF